MGSGKTMLVSEMAQAVLKEDAPVCIEAFDGSTFGPEDADLQVRVTSPKAIYQLASNLNEIGLARAYILGYFDIEGLDVADPYPQLRKLVELASYIRKPSPLELARMGAVRRPLEIRTHQVRSVPAHRKGRLRDRQLPL